MAPKRREYYRKKRASDPLYRLRTNIRSSLYKSFKRIGQKKPTNTFLLLGASYDVVRKHIEDRFTEGMSWENYGQWDIDHIHPLITAKTEDELRRLCHYSNLQPLWEIDNILKGSKIAA